MSTKITSVHGREILDSRGNPSSKRTSTSPAALPAELQFLPAHPRANTKPTSSVTATNPAISAKAWSKPSAT